MNSCELNSSAHPPHGPTGVARAWLLVAVTSLALAALSAAVVVAARGASLLPWPELAPLLAPLFAPTLVLHVNLATLLWPLALASSLWLWLAAPPERWSWPVAGLAVAGVLALIAAVLAAPAAAVLSNYVPLLDAPLYLAGLACFGLAVAMTVLLVVPRWRALLAAPALTQPARWMLAGAMVPTTLALVLFAADLYRLPASLPLPQLAELLFWGPGHLLQFTMIALLAAAWLWLLRARALPPRLFVAALLATVLPALVAIPVAIGFEFGSAAQRSAFTELMRWGSWPGPVLLIVALVSARGLRLRLPVDSGEFAAWVSIALFGIGLISGTLIQGETTTVPAHYHATLGAMTLALLASVLQWSGARLRLALPIVYGIGAVLLVAGFALAGAHGAPRKSMAVLTEPAALAGLMLMSLGALALIAAVLAFAVSIIAGRRGRAGQARPRRVPDGRARALLASVAATAVLGTTFVIAGVGRDSRGVTSPEHPAQAEIRTRFNQGVLILHARQYEHALTAFHRVLQLAPTMPEAHVNMGYALIGLGRHKEAGDFFASALELRKEQVNAYFGLAVALDATGDRPGAIGAMRSFVHLAAAEDPFRRRGEAALWEWESETVAVPEADARRAN